MIGDVPGSRSASTPPRVRGVSVTSAALVLAAWLFLACGGDPVEPSETTDARSTMAAAEPTGGTGTPASEPPGPAPGGEPPRSDAQAAFEDAPSVERAMEHLRHLVEAVGIRPAGSEKEREAADYIAGALEDAGYDVQVEPFEFEAQIDESSVEVGLGNTLPAFTMQGSPNGEVRGISLFGGLGRPEDLAGTTLEGRVVIFDRGTVTFRDKVAAAIAGGAVGVVIVNDEPGPFRGSLGGLRPSIPVLAVAGEYRDDLEAAIGERFTLAANFRKHRKQSQNVVASLDGDECRGYLGAHYDSVPQGPGGNDNASGTAVILELARANPRPGLCVVAFGAEEVGLFGSQNYVQGHLAGTARFMLNVDMAARLDGPIIVGHDGLTEEILGALASAEVEHSLRAGAFPPFASSDHVSFSAVGVPAVTFNSGDDPEIHTAQDAMDRVDPRALEMFLHSVDVALDALLPVPVDAQ